MEQPPRGCRAQQAIRILGDVAIFVNMDSADVWVHPELFELDEELQPIRVAGVPPDYFSATGQRWGNPLYRWDVLGRHSGFAWWIDRIRRACELYDIVRLDHFRGFEAYWAIPADEETAINGEWIKAPGLELFRALEAALGPLPLVAEDLGLITPEVDALAPRARPARHEGSAVRLQQQGRAHPPAPPLHALDTVAYTGTHDNDTTLGWWQAAGQNGAQSRRGSGRSGEQSVPSGRSSAPPRPASLKSPSFPRKICLSLAPRPHEYPGRPRRQLELARTRGLRTPELAARLAALAEVTDRDNDPLGKPEEEVSEA